MTAWEQGADTVVMPATMGPCRLGEYGELLKEVLDREGFPFRWILLDSALAIGRRELWRRLGSIVESSPFSAHQKTKALRKTYKLIKGFERLEGLARWKSGYEEDAGASVAIVKTYRKKIEQASDLTSAHALLREGYEVLQRLPYDRNRNPVKLIVTGEFFSSIDAYGNRHLEEKLMQMGVSFEKRISLGWWINRTVLNPFGESLANRRKDENLPYCIGGYAKETIQEATRCKKEGCDGILQILPVGCMPEIVAKSIFDNLNRTEGLPVLSIVYDEMSGEAGYNTRIEAFVDLLSRKKQRKGLHVLPGNRCGIGQHGLGHHESESGDTGSTVSQNKGRAH